jgi:hypothetical protein
MTYVLLAVYQFISLRTLADPRIYLTFAVFDDRRSPVIVNSELDPRATQKGTSVECWRWGHGEVHLTIWEQLGFSVTRPQTYLAFRRGRAQEI